MRKDTMETKPPLNKTTLEVLEDARARITDVKNWTIGFRWGLHGDTNCALGAVEYAYGFRSWAFNNDCFSIDGCEAVRLLAQAATELEPICKDISRISHPATIVAALNNTLGHERTLAMFDRAIEIAKQHMEAVAEELIESAEEPVTK